MLVRGQERGCVHPSCSPVRQRRPGPASAAGVSESHGCRGEGGVSAAGDSVSGRTELREEGGKEGMVTEAGFHTGFISGGGRNDARGMGICSPRKLTFCEVASGAPKRVELATCINNLLSIKKISTSKFLGGSQALLCMKPC